MRLIKWLLIACLFGGLYLGWSQSGGQNPLPTFVEQGRKFFSFRLHVEDKLDKKNWVTLDGIPLYFQQAIISIEDNRFYQHAGIDLESVMRATLVNLQSGELVEGGSTITQQLVKNLFLTQDRTWSRKAFELPLTFLMENQFSKKEILEMYLNSIYFGSGAYGIGPAAKVYFAKTPDKLSLAEATLIAGLPAAPSLYSPLVDLPMAKQRQKIVLAAMVKHGYLNSSQAETIRNTPLKISQP